MKRRIDVSTRMNAGMNRGRIIGIAAPHALALDQFQRLRSDPAYRLRRERKRNIVELHASHLRIESYSRPLTMTSAAERLTTKARRTRSPGHKSFRSYETSFVSFVFFVVNDPCVRSGSVISTRSKLRVNSGRNLS